MQCGKLPRLQRHVCRYLRSGKMGAYKFGQKWGIGRWTRGLMTLVRSCVARKKIGCSLCGISAVNKNRGVTLVNSNGSSSKTSNFSNGLTVHSHRTADCGLLKREEWQR